MIYTLHISRDGQAHRKVWGSLEAMQQHKEWSLSWGETGEIKPATPDELTAWAERHESLAAHHRSKGADWFNQPGQHDAQAIEAERAAQALRAALAELEAAA